jgi:hypothetical protein
MPLLPLNIPPGQYRNGTEYQSAGRWRDGNLIRFHEGSLRPIGGWRQRGSVDIDGVVRSMIAWEDNNNTRRIALGTHNKLFTMTAGNFVRDVTPTGFVAGRVDATLNTGFGAGPYGSEEYGLPRQDTVAILPATVWSLDNWGEFVVGCTPDDGKIYEWDLENTEGDQIVINGNFASGSSWTTGASWTIGSGVATFSGTATGDTLVQTYAASTFEIGKTYRLTFDFATTTGGDVSVTFVGAATLVDATYDVDGTYTIDFVADSTDGTLTFELGTVTGDTETFTIDNVSIKLQPIAYVIANAPVDNSALMVTEERFLFAFGAGGNPRKVQWSDREDNTTWTAAATNEAGDIELQTNGIILRGLRTRGQALILTDQDAHTATYQGPPFVYGFERVGTSCGLIAPNAAAAIDPGVFWMGQRAFFVYSGGAVQELPCEVSDYVFSDLNTDQRSKISVVVNSQWQEIWWFYPSGASKECDRYVAYDYSQNAWITGTLSRTAGVDQGVFARPMWIHPNGILYEHEIGFNYQGSTPFCESGPIALGAGDQVMSVRQLIPDERTLGDVTAIFKTRFYPIATERSYGPFNMANPTSVRFTGRQVRMRVQGNQPADWRVGIMRLDVVPGGLR